MNKGMLAVFGMAGLLLSGCITTSMQGYADRELPARPVKRIATYVQRRWQAVCRQWRRRSGSLTHLLQTEKAVFSGPR